MSGNPGRTNQQPYQTNIPTQRYAVNQFTGEQKFHTFLQEIIGTNLKWK